MTELRCIFLSFYQLVSRPQFLIFSFSSLLAILFYSSPLFGLRVSLQCGREREREMNANIIYFSSIFHIAHVEWNWIRRVHEGKCGIEIEIEKCTERDLINKLHILLNEKLPSKGIFLFFSLWACPCLLGIFFSGKRNKSPPYQNETKKEQERAFLKNSGTFFLFPYRFSIFHSSLLSLSLFLPTPTKFLSPILTTTSAHVLSPPQRM